MVVKYQQTFSDLSPSPSNRGLTYQSVKMPRQNYNTSPKATNKTKLKLEVMFCSDGTLHGAGVQTKINHVKGLVLTCA